MLALSGRLAWLAANPWSLARLQEAITALPGLVGYGIADLETTAEGAAVASWTNLANGSLTPAQGTASNRPTMRRTAGIGPRAAIEFATDDRLDFAGGMLDWARNVGGMTLLMVVEPTALNAVVGSGAPGIFFSTNPGATRLALAQDGNSQTQWILQARQLDAGALGTLGSGFGTQLVGVRQLVVGTIDYAAGIGATAINGTERLRNATLTPAGSTSNTASLNGYLGYNNTAFLNAKMGLWAVLSNSALFAGDARMRAFAMAACGYYRIPMAG